VKRKQGIVFSAQIGTFGMRSQSAGSGALNWQIDKCLIFRQEETDLFLAHSLGMYHAFLSL
jgi:hypothetical protein